LQEKMTHSDNIVCGDNLVVCNLVLSLLSSVLSHILGRPAPPTKNLTAVVRVRVLEKDFIGPVVGLMVVMLQIDLGHL